MHDNLSHITVKQSKDPYFMYVDEPQSHLLPDIPGALDPHIKLSPMALHDAITGASTDYHYFTAPLSAVVPSLARRSEEMNGMAELRQSSGASGPLSVWVGGRGCCTQAHYDTEDNIFMQIHGTKKFTFYGPDTPKIHPYPDAHPRARKSQINFQAEGAPTNHGLTPAWEVTLVPGDAVSIPAFWWHHVEALSDSVSLNLFSPSPLWTQAEEILSSQTPWSPETPPEASMICLYSFISHLLPRIGFPIAAVFIEDMLASRFDLLQPSQGPVLDQASSESLQAAVVADMAANGEIYHGLGSILVERFERFEEQEGGKLAKMLVLAHLIELWVVRIAGPKSAATVLRCFTQV